MLRRAEEVCRMGCDAMRRGRREGQCVVYVMERERDRDENRRHERRIE